MATINNDTPDFSYLIGKHIKDVVLPDKYSLRVTMYDNILLDISMDFRPTRVNVHKVNDIIVVVDGLY